MAKSSFRTMSVHFDVLLTEEEYEPFRRLEGLTGEECYDKFGLKREESVSMVVKIHDRWELHMAQSVPYQEDLTTSAYGTLHDIEQDRWVDCYEPDDTILGEYCFIVDDIEFYINVLLDKK